MKRSHLSLIIFMFISLPSFAADDSISKQNESTELVAKYIESSDWQLRLKIMQLSGVSESIATRIFKAFNVITQKAAPCGDRDIVDDAWDEILRNPRYSIHILESVIREKLPANVPVKEEGNFFVIRDNIKYFFQICVYAAVISNEELGIERLKVLSNDSDGMIANEAKEYIKYYDKLKHSPRQTRGIQKKSSKHSKCYKEWLWE